MHLEDMSTTALVIRNLLSLDDLDRLSLATMTTSHLAVHGSDGVSETQRTVFLVHIVSARTGIVTEPNTKVLNLFRFLLADLGDGKDFTTGLLGLTDFLHEVPKLRTGHDGSTSAHLHAVNL